MSQHREQVSQDGPWPFVTRRAYRFADGAIEIWNSRHHRKGLGLPELAEAISVTERLLRCLWMPGKLNWWIGCVFALGSLLFALASIVSLMPEVASAWSLEAVEINAIYFAGSIPFTAAAYLQLFQAANAGEFGGNASQRSQVQIIGWRPWEAGWLSCALQFVGTILFNINTFDAMLPSLTWFEEDLLVWGPNIVGSILFLLSSYLAFIETCHSWWGMNLRSISWWIVFINLLGSIGFLISAVLSFVQPGPPNAELLLLAVAFTLQGALCFLVGSLLMLPETMVAPEETAPSE